MTTLPTITEANTESIGAPRWITTRCADASDLGLPPGRWPASLETTLGDGEALALVKTPGSDWEPAIYRSTSAELRIYND